MTKTFAYGFWDFERSTLRQLHCFVKNDTISVEARYKITKEDLEWLAERVKKLQTLTEGVCKKWIESLKAKSGNKVEKVE